MTFALICSKTVQTVTQDRLGWKLSGQDRFCLDAGPIADFGIVRYWRIGWSDYIGSSYQLNEWNMLSEDLTSQVAHTSLYTSRHAWTRCTLPTIQERIWGSNWTQNSQQHSNGSSRLLADNTDMSTITAVVDADSTPAPRSLDSLERRYRKLCPAADAISSPHSSLKVRCKFSLRLNE